MERHEREKYSDITVEQELLSELRVWNTVRHITCTCTIVTDEKHQEQTTTIESELETKDSDASRGIEVNKLLLILLTL